MIKVNPNPDNWTKPLYIATYTGVLTIDDEGNEIRTYNKPVKYEFNYQPVSSYLDIQTYGKDANITQRIVVPSTYNGIFKEYDLVYLDGATPDNELSYGDNANYILTPPKVGNSVINLYCQKIKGK